MINELITAIKQIIISITDWIIDYGLETLMMIMFLLMMIYGIVSFMLFIYILSAW